MNILIVNTYLFYGGGDSTYTLNLGELLKEHNHHVIFFGMHDSRNLSFPDDDLFVTSIDYQLLNQNKNFLNGLKVIRRSIYSFEAKRKIFQLLKRYKFDVVHLNNLHHHITPAIIFEIKKQKIPVVWTLHDYKLLCPNTHFLIDKGDRLCEACWPNKYFRAMINRCKKGSFLASTVVTLEAYVHRYLKVKELADRFITPSLFLKNKLLEYGFKESKIEYIPHFIPDAYFNLSYENENYFLYIGKILRIKGLEVLVEAARLNPQCKVFIAGDGDKEIKENILSKMPANVKYLGPQNREKVQELIAKSTAVILPSLCYENQPFCILEAFAKGKPVITSKLGGMIELVGNNERGLLVPPGDPKALAEAMEWILQNPSRTKKLGESAYEYVREKHTSKRYYNELMKIYEEVLS
ncbi:MAG: glycosyltransferase family 4 protein [candidate division WOR-3 bacterium]